MRILEIQGLAKSSSIIFQILITNGHWVKVAGMFKTQSGTTSKSQYEIHMFARIQITLTIIKSYSVTTVKPMKIWFFKPEHCTI